MCSSRNPCQKRRPTSWQLFICISSLSFWISISIFETLKQIFFYRNFFLLTPCISFSNRYLRWNRMHVQWLFKLLKLCLLFIYIRLIIDCALSCCLLGKITIVLFLPMEIQMLLEVYIINRQICNLEYALQFKCLGSAIKNK